MAEFQRKIELQSPDDLQYLVSNIRRAAHERIDKDYPLMDGEDTFRPRVEEIIHEYVNSIIKAASKNITINGLDPSNELMAGLMQGGKGAEVVLEEHEPFNTKLFEKARDLARQEEDLIEEIAALRRRVPGQVKETISKEYKEGIEHDEDVLRDLDERMVDTGKGSVDLGVHKLERQEEVEKSWEKSVKGLGGLMRSMPEMVARKERAEKAEEYVINGSRK